MKLPNTKQVRFSYQDLRTVYDDMHEFAFIGKSDNTNRRPVHKRSLKPVNSEFPANPEDQAMIVPPVRPAAEFEMINTARSRTTTVNRQIQAYPIFRSDSTSTTHVLALYSVYWSTRSGSFRAKIQTETVFKTELEEQAVRVEKQTERVNVDDLLTVDQRVFLAFFHRLANDQRPN